MRFFDDKVFFHNSRKYIFVVLLFAAAGIFFVNQYAFLDFPNSGDEYSYQIMAQTLLEGKLSVPSPPLKEFFNFSHVINDGKFYGKYSPGWPFFLMFGFLIGSPMVINLLFSLASVGVYSIPHCQRAVFSAGSKSLDYIDGYQSLLSFQFSDVLYPAFPCFFFSPSLPTVI